MLHVLAHFVRQQGGGVCTNPYEASGVETPPAMVPPACQHGSVVRTDSYEASGVETMPALAPLTRQSGSGVHTDEARKLLLLTLLSMLLTTLLYILLMFFLFVKINLPGRLLSVLDVISTAWAEVAAL